MAKIVVTPQLAEIDTPVALAFTAGGNADGYVFDNKGGKVSLAFRSTSGADETVTIFTRDVKFEVADLQVTVPADGSLVFIDRLSVAMFNQEDEETGVTQAVYLNIPSGVEFAMMKEA